MRCLTRPCKVPKLAGPIGTRIANQSNFKRGAVYALSSTEPAIMTRNMRAFEFNFSGEDINDLKERLAKTRWPDQLQTVQWEYGMELSYAKVRERFKLPSVTDAVEYSFQKKPVI